MNVSEVEDISSILRNILSDASNFMDSLPPILILPNPTLIVEHHEIRFYFWVRVDPNINESVDFLSHIFPLPGVFTTLLPSHFGALLVTEILVVFNSLVHDWLTIVI